MKMVLHYFSLLFHFNLIFLTSPIFIEEHKKDQQSSVKGSIPTKRKKESHNPTPTPNPNPQAKDKPPKPQVPGRLTEKELKRFNEATSNQGYLSEDGEDAANGLYQIILMAR
jgi:hypothetical protein